ncbi:MAG: YigZ family protein [Flavobacteriaceae bacterium]|uniref:YigZ family protein n=1 Tax=Flavobacterium kayseriense TaxID=2764714 RepID=A0ABR7J3E8_9FLAO|nr:YigZ family protein [Flavobacterium kayseriense]MBC5839829.1 YigZ family protein [Flavobacterium kayseriense]MBC5847501.1 YigZ family protein [Flavobacterium kayseriense]MBX9889247.1 YigZ family protein [Flavobacteriaceae bacterium]
MENIDTYKTIDQASEEILFKEKNSKFFGYAFPFESEDELKPIIDGLKKQHPNAGHFCYAYQIGTNKIYYRANDDGEPSNSAGMPIYGQIQSFGVTNILIVVVRLFGGVKLGVGGLISAYKTAAQLSLENCDIIEKTIDVQYQILFEYKNMNKVMRIIKEKNLDIVSQKMEMSCEIIIKTRKKNAEIIFDIFNSLFEIKLKIIE